MSRSNPWSHRAVTALILSALAFVLAPSTASAVTLGQLDPADAGMVCVNTLDLVQPSVTDGNGYIVPSTGGISSWKVTSWSTKASDDPGAMGVKFFRKVADPARFQVVARDAVHPLTAGVNTFPVDLEVQAGDILGAHFAGSGACAFDAPDLVYFVQDKDLAPGESDDFDGDGPARLNISAELTPTSEIAVGKAKARKNGTAVLTVTVSNPGDLAVSGKGVKGAVSAGSARAVSAGTVKLVIRAKGKNKRKLIANGKVTVKPTITFTPTGGTSTTEKKKVKLRRR